MKIKVPDIHWEKALENLPVKILAVALALMLFVFHRIDSLGQKELTLPVETVLDPGFIPSSVPLQRAKVLLRGPRTVLESFQAEDLRVVADLSQEKAEGPVRVPLAVLRSGLAAELPEVEILVDPLDMKLELEKRTSKIVEVQPQFTGAPAPDHEVNGIEFQPGRVTLVGPRSRIDPVRQISTEKIDILGLSDDLVKDVRLVLPDPSLSLLGGSTIRVTVDVKALETEGTFGPSYPQVQGLSPDLRLARQPQAVMVKVRGPAGLMKDGKSPDLDVVLDLDGIREPGLYEIPVSVTLPEGFSLVGLTPEVQILAVEER